MSLWTGAVSIVSRRTVMGKYVKPYWDDRMRRDGVVFGVVMLFYLNL